MRERMSYDKKWLSIWFSSNEADGAISKLRRNVTADNYFTSIKITDQWKTKKTSIVSTINTYRREVPHALKAMKQELYSTEAYKCESSILTVYQGKSNKSGIVLSTLHPHVNVKERKYQKPYNFIIVQNME